MFFILSKVLWWLTAPPTLLLLLILVGACLQYRGTEARQRKGRAMVMTGVLALLFFGIVPVGNMLLRPLEDRFQRPPDNAPAPDGIIVLGGSTDQRISKARNIADVADAADCITYSVILSRRYPDARMVFTGGSAALRGTELKEGDVVFRLWTEMGMNPARVTIEKNSRNTDENARFTRELLVPKASEQWWLLTSAFHMPRALALFRANDLPVRPYAVDYRTTGTWSDFKPNLNIIGNLAQLNMAVHEWIGLIAYRLTGRTRTLLPEA